MEEIITLDDAIGAIELALKDGNPGAAKGVLLACIILHVENALESASRLATIITIDQGSGVYVDIDRELILHSYPERNIK